MTVLVSPSLEWPQDSALPGLSEFAPPERMLGLLRTRLTRVSSERRGHWSTCNVQEAVYQPGRACRIVYALGGEDSRRRTLVYARWDADPRSHASAIHIDSDGARLQVFRYPRDRRMRQIRSMRRRDWLVQASQQWFCDWLGGGRFAPGGWRCTPIKYVPESRLICRLKGRWTGHEADRWVRAYVRIARQNDAQAQFDAIQQIAQSFAQQMTALTVPHALGCLPERHLLATEFVRGRTLREVAQTEGPDGLAAICRQLAALGRCRPALRPALAPPKGAAAPRAMLADLARGHPILRTFCDRLADWAEQTPPSPHVPNLVHGDLHGGQVLVKGPRICVVDWDRAALGDGTQDITNLAAEWAAVRWMADDQSAAELPDLPALCVDAWRGAGGPWNPAAARWWTTRALVLRTWGLLRHLRTGWPRTTVRLLSRALEVFETGCGWVR